MTYIFCYDFPSGKPGDRRRARLAKRLEALGLRVQYSVFELQLPPEKLPRVIESLSEILDISEDSLRIYPVCASCQEKAIRLGVQAPCEHGKLMVW